VATLTHNDKYACAFDLTLSEWERYSSEKGNSNIETVSLGEPYTLWVKYRMALRVGDRILYQSEKDTTLVLEDVRGLIENLRQLANGKKDRVAFDPIEPDFGLVIRNLTESDASVMISSAADPPATRPVHLAGAWQAGRHERAGIRADMPTGATNESTEPSSLFDVNVWIDHPNQVDRFYGGYGPGLYFFVESYDIARFADQLQEELDGLGSYFPATNSK
jgi:hypothetical protein